MQTKAILMNPLRGAAIAVLLASTALAAHAAGKVEVRYVDAEKFTDVGFGTLERERTLKALTEVLQGLGRDLPDGQTLQLEVTDVDLAGSVEYWRPTPLRIMRGRADWPRIDLRYSLQAGGSVLKSGQAALSDMTYLMDSTFGAGRDGELSFEKRMLKKWFTATFGTAPRNNP